MMITKPGVFDISLEQYHGAEICPAPSISSSGLVEILRCPAKYWWDSPLNPAREPVDTNALRIGRAIHALLLEGEDAFRDRFGILPEGMDLRGNAGKALKAEIEESGRDMLRFADVAKLRAMVEAVKRHPRAAHVFTEGAAEKTLAWQDEETGVWLRCRPDWLPTDPTLIPDYKSTICAARADFERAVWSYGYHQKMAHVMAGIRAVGLGEPQHAYFVAQEKEAPYLCAVYALDTDALEWGDVQNRAAIRTFARCLETNTWPGYAETVQEISLPIFAQKQLMAADLTGAPQQETTDEPSRRYGAEDYLRAG